MDVVGKKSVIYVERAEELSCVYLKKNGYEIIGRNWRCKYGELDIVAFQELAQIVFFEVKYRKSLEYGLPVQAISPRKILKLSKAISCFLLENDLYDLGWRLDGLSLYYKQGHLKLKHYSNLLANC